MKDFRIGQLNDIYGALLSDKHSDILRHYFDFDLSYGEIAQIFSISRQAVGQIIESCSKQLDSFENSLNISKILSSLIFLKETIPSTNDNLIEQIDAIISMISPS